MDKRVDARDFQFAAWTIKRCTKVHALAERVETTRPQFSEDCEIFERLGLI
jgi:hypothetical protein